jgi:hypothetical protein
VTRREIVDLFLEHVGDLGDTNARTRAGGLLRRAQFNVWILHPWRDHRMPTPAEITLVAEQRIYALPAWFGRVPPMTEFLVNLTNGHRLALVEGGAFREQFPHAGTDLEEPGLPSYAVIEGHVGVATQPASGGQALEVLSSSAADTAVEVTVEGRTTAGDYDETTVTLTGTTAVALGSWREVINFSKAYPSGTDPTTAETSSEGTVTLRVASAGATLGTLQPDQSAQEFPALVVYPAPSTAGDVLAVPFIRAPKLARRDSDELPQFWTEALLEEMVRLWRDKSGEGPGKRGPALLALVAHDNTATAPQRIRHRPFPYRHGR